jgi:hypothetical protein
MLLYAAFFWRLRSHGRGLPPEIHVYLSVKPQMVMPTHLETCLQAETMVA